ncbi:hypothetical protein ACYSNR_02960 [Enterococcus sp. LJL128]
MMKTKVMVGILGAVACLGLVSQAAEKELDKEEIKSYVVNNFKEHDERDALIDFDNDEKEEHTFMEWLGF